MLRICLVHRMKLTIWHRAGAYRYRLWTWWISCSINNIIMSYPLQVKLLGLSLEVIQEQHCWSLECTHICLVFLCIIMKCFRLQITGLVHVILSAESANVALSCTVQIYGTWHCIVGYVRRYFHQVWMTARTSTYRPSVIGLDFLLSHDSIWYDPIMQYDTGIGPS